MMNANRMTCTGVLGTSGVVHNMKNAITPKQITNIVRPEEVDDSTCTTYHARKRKHIVI